MSYIYDFDIGSILFFGLTIFFYLRHKRVRDTQDKIYTIMLFASLTAVVFDFASSSMEGYALLHPSWLLALVNMLFIFGMQTCLPFFFLYSAASAGIFRRFTKVRRLLAFLPYLIIVALLLISPFVRFGIFYINESHIYVRGPLNMLLYVNTALYVIAGIYVLSKNGKNVAPVKRNVILFFVVVLFSASALQILFPRYLLTASATAISLTAVFYALQSPLDQVNPLTGAFSRTLLPQLMQNNIDFGRSYTLIVVALRSFDRFVRLYGAAAGDQLLSEYSTKLMARHPNDVVVYMDSCEFVIVCSGLMSREEAEALYISAPTSSHLAGRDVQLDISLGVIPYEVNEDSMPDTVTVDYMLRSMRDGSANTLIYADESYRRACEASLSLEGSLRELIRGDRLDIDLSPVRGFDGAEAAREAIPSLSCADIGSLSADKLLRAIEQSGCGLDYYEAVLRHFSPIAGVFTPERRLCLGLLLSSFVKDGLPEKLRHLLDKYGFSAEQIMFSLEESELASALPELTENIRALSDMGCAFMVDSFAEGYTDMSLLISLPLKYARLHESLVDTSESSLALLRGLLDILSDVGLVALRP